MLRKTEVTKHLGIKISHAEFQRLLEIGREHDINQGGLWDARSGVVNFWCSPEDKPECWGEVTKGGLDYPRSYVGGVYYDHDEGELYLSVSPYDMLETWQSDENHPELGMAKKPTNLTDQEWEQCVAWCEKQVRLLTLAGRLRQIRDR